MAMHFLSPELGVRGRNSGVASANFLQVSRTMVDKI